MTQNACNHTWCILLPVYKVTFALTGYLESSCTQMYHHEILPVNVAHPVYGVNGEDHFTGIEPSHLLRKVILELAEQRQDIATHIVVHHQVLEWGERCGGWCGG